MSKSVEVVEEGRECRVEERRVSRRSQAAVGSARTLAQASGLLKSWEKTTQSREEKERDHFEARHIPAVT